MWFVLPCGDAPVDHSHVVARLVGTHFREIDSATLKLRQFDAGLIPDDARRQAIGLRMRLVAKREERVNVDVRPLNYGLRLLRLCAYGTGTSVNRPSMT